MNEVADDWPLPDEMACPECGEDLYLAANVESLEFDDDETRIEAARMHCIEEGRATGCGHSWRWER